MTDVATAFGTFRVEDGDYAVNDSGDGAVIHLLFLPGANVDATKLGIVQVANTLIDSSPEALGGDVLISRHFIPDGEPGAGSHVDQDPANKSPLYALSTSPGDGDALGDGSAHAGLGALGHRFWRGDGGLDEAPAALRDGPRVLREGRCAQVFESACIAVEGAQAGTWYGSVSWGWERSAEGALVLHELTVRSPSGASAVFRRAVEVWNASTTESGARTIPLPLPPGEPGD